MDPLTLGVAAGAAAVSVAALYWAAARRAGDWWDAAAAARLVEVRVEKTAGMVASLHGRSGTLAVRIESFAYGKHSRGTRLVVGGLRHAPGELSLRGEGLGSAVGKVLGRGEAPLGDPAFDKTAYLQGSAELACALFDGETRTAVRQLLEGYVPLASGRLVALDAIRAWMADSELGLDLRRHDQASLALPALLAVAARLVRPADLAARLAVNLEREPLPGVRLAIVKVLLDTHHKHPRARQALQHAARRDDDEEVRLRAALALGVDGWESLLAMAASVVPVDGRSARAIAGLGDHLAVEQAEAILAQSLRTRRLETARACVESLGRRAGERTAEVLRNVLAVETGPLAVAAARALAAGHDPAAAQAMLVLELGRHDAETTAGIAAALAGVGTAAAVAPLRGAGERHGGEVRHAASQAIAAIQGRLLGAAPGQLSLAAEPAGQVSLVEGGDEARGRVSAAPGEAAQACTKNSSLPAGVAEPSRKKETL